MTDERMPPPGEDATPGAAPADLDPAPADAERVSTAGAGAPSAGRAETSGGRPENEQQPEDAASVPADVPDRAKAPAEPIVSSVSPDVDLAQDASPLPGAHRGGFHRLPTAPVAVTVETAPAEPRGDFTPDDTTWTATDSAFHRGLAGWALAFAIVGLLVSMFVGWGFPIGLVAVVSAIIALRRPLESRAVAVWAIVLGTLSILYSAGWLLYAAAQAHIIG
ncbi:hypothetical protein ACEYYH_04720 [Microbacterium trichothecenolyticum]|uniref:hypothetical protein n=1 Tax=Microbacterium trichothecenolyticum TaxID=69370 RepID=UPI0035BE916B